MPNALEEAVGSDPNGKTPLTTLLKLSTAADQASDFLMITVPRLVAGGGPNVELEGVGALDGSPWQGGPDIFEELPGNNVPCPGASTNGLRLKPGTPPAAARSISCA